MGYLRDCAYKLMTYPPISLIFVSVYMITSSNGTIFRVAGHLCGEFTGDRWIPLTKDSEAKLWYILWSAREYTVE